MMISPETFYEMNLKGKSAEEIMAVINGLKRKISKLKNIIEHPNYPAREVAIFPSESTQVSLSRWYLERAKQALEEAGGTYVSSAAEKKAIDFDNNIPFINKIEFCIGGFFDGFKNKTYTIDGDEIHIHIEHSYIPELSNVGDDKLEKPDKDIFLDTLEELHIGEWRKHYDLKRYGYFVMDGTQWHLEIYFSNGHKPVKIYGDNAYPYNFDKLLDLFEINEAYS